MDDHKAKQELFWSLPSRFHKTTRAKCHRVAFFIPIFGGETTGSPTLPMQGAGEGEGELTAPAKEIKQKAGSSALKCEGLKGNESLIKARDD